MQPDATTFTLLVQACNAMQSFDLVQITYKHALVRLIGYIDHIIDIS
jgi:hypothetical protein